MSPPAYTIVIATFERPEALTKALDSVVAQSHPPEAVVIVDASDGEQSRRVSDRFAKQLTLHYLHADQPSAAVQRNQGAQIVTTPLIALIDDDVVLAPDNFQKLCNVFANDLDRKIGGVAGRIADMQHSPPGRLLHAYYRFQAGYQHPDYGARLFGPGINCLPSYLDPTELIAADWLHSTCVVYRRAAFMAEQFPEFAGYSFLEDVHLSARIAKTQQLYFHRNAVFAHHSGSSCFKRDYTNLARRRIANQRALCRDVLELSGPGFACKFFLHQLFISVSILRSGSAGRWQELRGVWT